MKHAAFTPRFNRDSTVSICLLFKNQRGERWDPVRWDEWWDQVTVSFWGILAVGKGERPRPAAGTGYAAAEKTKNKTRQICQQTNLNTTKQNTVTGVMSFRSGPTRPFRSDTETYRVHIFEEVNQGIDHLSSVSQITSSSGIITNVTDPHYRLAMLKQRFHACWLRKSIPRHE